MDKEGIFAFAFDIVGGKDIGAFIYDAYDFLGLAPPKKNKLAIEVQSLVKGESISPVVLCYCLIIILNHYAQLAEEEGE